MVTTNPISRDIISNNHTDVCICMIDIVGFSKWCRNKPPKYIFDTMTSYNTFLTDLITPFVDVEKIEMVGDSVLIIAGLAEIIQVDERVENILDLATTILLRLEYIQGIFDKNTSLRIGIHVGDVYSGFINHPTRFQFFGSSINTASRLESKSDHGTFTISNVAYRKLADKRSLTGKKFVLGNPVVSCFKGVGEVIFLPGNVCRE